MTRTELSSVLPAHLNYDLAPIQAVSLVAEILVAAAREPADGTVEAVGRVAAAVLEPLLSWETAAGIGMVLAQKWIVLVLDRRGAREALAVADLG